MPDESDIPAVAAVKRVTRWEWQDAVQQSAVSAPLRALAWALFSHMDDHGVCWPGGQRLEQRSGMSSATRKRNMAALEEAGCIQRTAYAGEPGRSGGKTNRYVATVPVRRNVAQPACPMQSTPARPKPVSRDGDAPALTGPHHLETGSSAAHDRLTDEPQTSINHQPNPHPTPCEGVDADAESNSVWVQRALSQAGHLDAASEVATPRQRDQLDDALGRKLRRGGWTAPALAEHVVRSWPREVVSPVGLLKHRIQTAPNADPCAADAAARARHQAEVQRQADEADAEYKTSLERTEPARRALAAMSDDEIRTKLLPQLEPTLRELDISVLKTLGFLDVHIAADANLFEVAEA